ncbi:MAG: TIGR02301 family protein [Rhizobiales bacterium]|nr:TIGR02301 family protein [Hyphomicrobiales bacterium]
MKRWCCLVAASLLASSACFAQQPQPRRQPAAPAAQPATPPRSVLPAEYERPILELSETMGSLAFLTTLCRPAPGQNPWRRRMEELVESEGSANANREKLMGAYNQGFSAFSTTYRQCTDAARAARSVLVREAARLAREIERRYGG